ncbi:hypothetical protein pb186bvf_003755 [Paramecium bursaria]
MNKRQDSKRKILTTQNKENIDNTYSKKHSKNQQYSTKNSSQFEAPEAPDDQDLLQIIAKQKKEINQLKLGCQRCVTKQNSEIQLRNKILQQNTQILQLLQVEMPQIDIDLKLQIDALRDQLQQVTELNIVLSQENTILKTLCENRENISSQLMYSMSQSQGRTSSLHFLQSQMLQSQVQSPTENKNNYFK